MVWDSVDECNDSWVGPFIIAGNTALYKANQSVTMFVSESIAKARFLFAIDSRVNNNTAPD